ncbi:hypothetical protein [Kibdelosporangium phytohabitans]|uniref:Methyltransferase type 11 domain-containing protein n=1 Tax=Kibdelosporangium phytohabitans TaxID=860235 RepID=A0A0N7F2X6_9PSEU|nr:hypothetical protein [Kibdelosporangium phytohabitans]ALG07055.1 hypothetical protein AOZ06_09050 [Kibdelosporangium phytohabitans]MBE1468353.1 hypothetical protein [Kibdelosporangium phytohabitans]
MFPLRILQRDVKSEVEQIAGILEPCAVTGTLAYLPALTARGFQAAPAGPADAMVLMSEIGGLIGNDSIRAALTAAHARLRPGGILVFDVLDGESVLTASLPLRGLVEEASLLCGHSSDVRTGEQVYELNLRTWRLMGEQVVSQTAETRLIRYFLPRELRLLLSVCGFTQLGAEPFTDPALAWFRLVSASRT